MPWERDVGAFDSRADTYETGWRGTLHNEIVRRTLDLALAVCPEPESVLDVGCGTGVLLRDLASRLSSSGLSGATGVELVGIDAAPRMIAAALAAAAAEPASEGSGPAASFGEGSVENLPFEDARFDLVISTTSFDHWEDQGRGLEECARVLRPRGHLVCVDQFSNLLWPTLLVSRRGKARTKNRAERLLFQAGFAPDNVQ